MTFSEADLNEAAELARSFRLSTMRLRLLAQPQVQREMMRLAHLRAVAPAEYWEGRDHLVRKLRGFYTADEIDLKSERLADPDYPNELVWAMNFVMEPAPPPPRQRAPRKTGEPFRHQLDHAKDIWVDERIESAARHIAASLDQRAAPGWAPKVDTGAARQQVKRLRDLLSD